MTTPRAPRTPLLTVEEIAAELRLTEDEVRKLIRRGTWTAVKVGRRWLTAPDELDRYLASLPRNR